LGYQLETTQGIVHTMEEAQYNTII